MIEPVPTAGLLIGLAFGAIVERTGFCTMGAIADAVALGQTARLRAWACAVAVAIFGTQALQLAGIVDLQASIYTASRLAWLGNLAGGVAFGIGMTLAGGCGSRTLARLGAGNLKSLIVVLVLAVAAYATLRGVIAPLRIAAIDATAATLGGSQALPELLADGSAMSRALIVIGLAGTLLYWSLRGARFDQDARTLGGGIAIGLLVVVGWITTGVVGHDDFEPTPLASLTFVAPIGDSLVYLMLFTGTPLTFGVATCAGVVAGAGISARAAGRWRVEVFVDRADLLRHLAGGTLMGIGGVLAVGCTIGQGITGMSTLALGSFLAIGGIAVGGALTTHYLAENSWIGAWHAFLGRGSRD